MHKKCETCRYFKSENKKRSGICTVNPPQMHVQSTQGYNTEAVSEIYSNFYYPNVEGTYLACGFHDKKPVSMRDRGRDEYVLDGMKPKKISTAKSLGFKAIHKGDV